MKHSFCEIAFQHELRISVIPFTLKGCPSGGQTQAQPSLQTMCMLRTCCYLKREQSRVVLLICFLIKYDAFKCLFALCARDMSLLCAQYCRRRTYLEDLRQIFPQNYPYLVQPSKINCIHANEDFAMKQTANHPYVSYSLGDMFRLLAHTVCPKLFGTPKMYKN